MASGFSVDPVHIRGIAPQFAASGAGLNNVRASLEADLSIVGNALWGENEKAHADYERLAGTLLASVGVLGEGMAGIATALHAMAENFETTDVNAAPAPRAV